MVVIRTLVARVKAPSNLLCPLKGDSYSKSTAAAGVSHLTKALMSGLARQPLSPALELVSPASASTSPSQPRPLVLLMAWMLARQRHLDKYCEFYTRRGCDVLTVKITPWQLLWPVSGSQLVAEEVLQFLLKEKATPRPMFLHGFSVGGYVWGEVMVKMQRDLDTYQPILQRITGQAWDSVADVVQLQVGLPLAIFPSSPIMRSALHHYIGYHLKAFYNNVTRHYVASSERFHETLVRSPALLLLSKTDPVGSMASNLRLKDKWDQMGIKVTWKCWDDSKHVSHYLKYKDEYIETLETFLDSLSQPKETRNEQKEIPREQERLKEKLQAKL